MHPRTPDSLPRRAPWSRCAGQPPEPSAVPMTVERFGARWEVVVIEVADLVPRPGRQSWNSLVISPVSLTSHAPPAGDADHRTSRRPWLRLVESLPRLRGLLPSVAGWRRRATSPCGSCAAPPIVEADLGLESRRRRQLSPGRRRGRQRRNSYAAPPTTSPAPDGCAPRIQPGRQYGHLSASTCLRSGIGPTTALPRPTPPGLPGHICSGSPCQTLASTPPTARSPPRCAFSPSGLSGHVLTSARARDLADHRRRARGSRRGQRWRPPAPAAPVYARPFESTPAVA
jgi:hypothetical protein